MQIKSDKFDHLGRDRSCMAEFSKNSDERKKNEVSYEVITKNIKNNEDENRKYRVQINKERKKIGLYLFDETIKDEFENIKNDSGLEGNKLFEYLIKYNKNNISTLEPIEEFSLKKNVNTKSISEMGIDTYRVINFNFLVTTFFKYHKRIKKGNINSKETYLETYNLLKKEIDSSNFQGIFLRSNEKKIVLDFFTSLFNYIKYSLYNKNIGDFFHSLDKKENFDDLLLNIKTKEEIDFFMSALNLRKLELNLSEGN